jgi:hypothetical protein
MLVAMRMSLPRSWVPLTLFIGALAASSNCGGKAVIDADAEDGNGGGGGQADPFAGVDCGPAGSCTFSCCLDLTQEDAPPFCATSCGVNVSSFACDGPEDCSGDACCGDVTGTSCKPACDFDEVERCHTDADCSDGLCTMSDVAGIPIGTCGR